MPARGGLDWAAAGALKEAFSTHTLFGLQTLPWACRIEEFGHEVKVMGTKSRVEAAARPLEKTPEVAKVLRDLLETQPASGRLLPMPDAGKHRTDPAPGLDVRAVQRLAGRTI
jgi:hypothetical protein